MTASFPRVLPRHALGCYLGAAALLYLFCAQLLAAIDIWLLPRSLLVEMLRYRAMWLVFFLTLPTVGYLLWRGSDLVAWWRAPAALTLDGHALHLGTRTVPYTDIASMRHLHNRDHLLLPCTAANASGCAWRSGKTPMPWPSTWKTRWAATSKPTPGANCRPAPPWRSARWA